MSPRARGSRPTTSSGSLDGQAVRRTTRSPSRPATTRWRHPDPWRRTQSSASSPTRCGSTSSSTATYDGFYGAFIHDPLVVATALDRHLVTSEALYVDVETRGELTTGMTVADRRHLTGKPPNVDVAVSADVATFLDRLIERVGGLAAARD